MRKEVLEFVERMILKTGINIKTMLSWMGLKSNKYYGWLKRSEHENKHNCFIPRDFWLADWEKFAIINFHRSNSLNGYRRLTYMMLDANVVAVSPSAVYRVLKNAGLIDTRKLKPSKKGTGFEQPLSPHKHWHIDVSYINVAGTFYYLCSVLDGYSRAIVHWNMKESMTESAIELILEKAKEKYPGQKPRIISDNGPQFISKEFKEYVRFSGMTHVRTAPYYPQSNGKIERWHKEMKQVIRPKKPDSLEEARKYMHQFVENYNSVRLHSALGYIAPLDYLAGKAEQIYKDRSDKMIIAKELRLKGKEKTVYKRGEEIDLLQQVV